MNPHIILCREKSAQIMEPHTQNSIADTLNTWWHSAANWEIAHGSLSTSVTVESSHSENLQSTSTSPLVLRPNSSNSGPCEINISFKQKHEIQQVYVRSTARVYEIYYSPDLCRNNEYLCTVRCGIAERDEGLLRTTDIEETIDKESKRCSKLAEEKSTNGSNNGSSEDDWVEVKIPHSPVLDNENSSLRKKPSASTSNIQDFYEATAEVSDPDPCMSLTIRLLSLQNKERVYVDEIYIFADPIDSSDSENQGAVQAGNTSGSSLMAMLAPTLLHLSKSGIARLQEDQPDTNKEHEYPESKKPESNNTSSQIPNDEKFKKQDGDNFFAKNDLYRQFENFFERLETRFSKFEDMFLRFEENMMKPINGIEMRLQSVEQQMAVLSSSFQNLPVYPPCNRFSAPAFSSMESYSSSYNEGTDLPPEKESLTNKIPKSLAHENSTPVISAEEQEEIGNSILLSDSSARKLKKMDAALTASFARFSLASVGTPKSADILDGNGVDDEIVEPLKSTDILEGNGDADEIVEPPKSTDILEGNGDADDIIEPPKSTDILEGNGDNNESVEHLKYNNILEGNGDDDVEIDRGCVYDTEPLKYKQTLKVTAPEFSIEDNISDYCVENSLYEESYESRTDCSSVGTDTGRSSSPRAKQSLKHDNQQLIEELGLKSDALVVDFETPILDVAFVSQEKSSLKSPLEVLLGDAEVVAEADKSSNLVVIGDEGTYKNQFLVDLEADSVGEVEVEGGDDKVTVNNNQVMFESLI